MICPNCGSEVTEDNVYCTNCGKALRGPAPSAPPSAPPSSSSAESPPVSSSPPTPSPTPVVQTSPKNPGKMPLIALLVIVIIIGSAFGVYATNSMSTINGLHSTINSQSSTISSQNVAISSQSAAISSQNAAISSDTSVIANQSNSISDLQDLLTHDQSSITDLEANVTALNANNSRLLSILDLENSTTVLSSDQFSQSSDGCNDATTISIQYSGYVLITFTSSSSEIFLGVAPGSVGCTASLSTPVAYVIPDSTSGSDVFPVSTGSGGSATVFVGNSDPSGATITVTVVQYW